MREGCGAAGCIAATDDQVGWAFVAAHPSDKNKDVARVGHPVGCGGDWRENDSAFWPLTRGG
jgi:hypothetical protein